MNESPCSTNYNYPSDGLCTISKTKVDGLLTNGLIDGSRWKEKLGRNITGVNVELPLRERRFVLCNHKKLWAEKRKYTGIYEGWEFVAADQDDFTRMPNNIPYSGSSDPDTIFKYYKAKAQLNGHQHLAYVDYFHDQMEKNGFYDYGEYQAFHELLNNTEFKAYVDHELGGADAEKYEGTYGLYRNSGGYVTFTLYKYRNSRYKIWKKYKYDSKYGDYYITMPNDLINRDNVPNAINPWNIITGRNGIKITGDNIGIPVTNNDYLPAARAALYYLIADDPTDEGYRTYKNRGGYRTNRGYKNRGGTLACDGGSTCLRKSWIEPTVNIKQNKNYGYLYKNYEIMKYDQQLLYQWAKAANDRTKAALERMLEEKEKWKSRYIKARELYLGEDYINEIHGTHYKKHLIKYSINYWKNHENHYKDYIHKYEDYTYKNGTLYLKSKHVGYNLIETNKIKNHDNVIGNILTDQKRGSHDNINAYNNHLIRNINAYLIKNNKIYNKCTYVATVEGNEVPCVFGTIRGYGNCDACDATGFSNKKVGYINKYGEIMKLGYYCQKVCCVEDKEWWANRAMDGLWMDEDLLQSSNERNMKFVMSTLESSWKRLNNQWRKYYYWKHEATVYTYWYDRESSKTYR